MNEQTGGWLEASAEADLRYEATPSLERRRLRIYAAMICADVVLIFGCFGIAAFVYEGRWFDWRTMAASKSLILLYLTLSFYSKAYSIRALSDWRYGVRKALIALFVAAVLLNIVAFYAKINAEYSRGSISIGMAFVITVMIVFRRAIPLLIDRTWGGRIRNELVIQDGGPRCSIPGAVTVKARQLRLDPERNDPVMMDRIGTLLRNQDRVVITCSAELRAQWSLLLQSNGVYGEIVSGEEPHLGSPAWNQVNSGIAGPLTYGGTDPNILTNKLVVSNGPLGLRARIMKRVFDTIIATALLVGLSPLLLVIAVLIRLEDGGPVFFYQRRQGKGNRLFNMVKFRSMRADMADACGDQSTCRSDMRVTRIGAFIRRTSIDELPQLLNVLKGDMSLVGPRPHAVGSRAGDQLFWKARHDYPLRHSLKPGLTGLAQVRGFRGATHQISDLTDRLRADLEYIANWSLMRDIEILVRTLGVLRHVNAY